MKARINILIYRHPDIEGFLVEVELIPDGSPHRKESATVPNTLYRKHFVDAAQAVHSIAKLVSDSNYARAMDKIVGNGESFSAYEQLVDPFPHLDFPCFQRQ